MNIGVLGTGVVGEAIASALVDKKHSVMIGSRTADNEKGNAWVKKAGTLASQGTFSDAVKFADLIIIALNGQHALNVIQSLEETNTAGKIIIDITNPLDFSKGMPPRIIESLGNGNSLGEEIQRALPNAFVVKTLNTVNYKLMVDARIVNNGDHNLFVCGNNADAKNKVMHFLVDNFHWKADHLIDLGGIEAARTVEAIVPFWVSVWQSLGTPLFNFKIVK
jgi:predicted dinucleotide-binding enzyme